MHAASLGEYELAIPLIKLASLVLEVGQQKVQNQLHVTIVQAEEK